MKLQPFSLPKSSKGCPQEYSDQGMKFDHLTPPTARTKILWNYNSFAKQLHDMVFN